MEMLPHRRIARNSPAPGFRASSDTGGVGREVSRPKAGNALFEHRLVDPDNSGRGKFARYRRSGDTSGERFNLATAWRLGRYVRQVQHLAALQPRPQQTDENIKSE